MRLAEPSTEKELMLRRLTLRRKLREAKPLKSDKEKISGIQNQITVPETPRFSAKTEKPFEASILHPFGCLWNRAGDEWKCGANRQGRHIQQTAELVYENFLPGTTKSDKGDGRAGG